MTNVTFDAGGLIAVERGDVQLRAIIQELRRRGRSFHVPPEVVAQVWRGGARQARLAAFLGSDDVEVPAYDGITARAVGVVSGRVGVADVVDVHVAVHARARGHAVVTSDPDDLRAIDPDIDLIEV